MKTPIAPHMSAFLHERLPEHRRASPNTSDSYAHAFRLLFRFASTKLHRAPSQLALEDLSASLILEFLADLEKSRNNLTASRNARLAAIKSFMRFIEHRVPSALAQILQVLAIPIKRTEVRLVNYLTTEEMQALIDSPDIKTRAGIRDRAMLHVTCALGLRVSELVGLRLADFSTAPRPVLLVRGKGRKERLMPLWRETAAAIRDWLSVRGESASPELFVNAMGQSMTRAGFKYILIKYVTRVGRNVPSLAAKRVSPHVLRHTCAMHTLHATRDVRKVALWLGHASTLGLVPLHR